MKLETIEHVESEVKRFLSRLEAVKYIEKENLARKKQADKEGKMHYWENTRTHAHGALKRSALDLKQALTYTSQNKDL